MFDRLPELLRRLRLGQKSTQEALADAAELSVGQVSRIEAGHQVPHLDTLRRMLEALGVATFDDFCRVYRNLESELDPEAEATEPGPGLEDLGLGQAEQAGADFAARLRPILDALPAGLNAVQLDLPRYVVYVLPKPRP